MLQTEELNQQEAMQKAEEVHQFREYRARILSIRDIDQEERVKSKDKVLEMYGEMRVSLKCTPGPQLTNSFYKDIIESHSNQVKRSLENI